jgi:hypothetical protein
MKIIAERHKDGHRQWLCVCLCGKEGWFKASPGTAGPPETCRCNKTVVVNPKKVGAPNFRHGKSTTRVHVMWTTMKQRCLNTRSTIYAEYGGRGIKICERWLSFDNFYADMGDPPEGMMLGLYPNPDGNYEPGNCAWVTRAENKRKAHKYTIDGVSKTLKEWAKATGLPYSTLYNRLVINKMDPIKAVTKNRATVETKTGVSHRCL